MKPYSSNHNRYFQNGGSLSLEMPSYIERSADELLYERLKEGKFCYVLTARQLGKSSLLVRTKRRLEIQDGYKCIDVDLTQIGSTGVTYEQWYFTMLYKICQPLGISYNDIDTWWDKKKKLPYPNRFFEFLERKVLPTLDKPIVIFLDEIDSILSVGKNDIKDTTEKRNKNLNLSSFSSDDFFALVRSLYNARSLNSDFNKINFALFGVAAPNDLIQDEQRTPFNIGEGVILDNFTIREAEEILITGFQKSGVQADLNRLVKAIFYWTNGQPYLTQVLCMEIITEDSIDDEYDVVERLVDELFESEQDTYRAHFSTIKNRIISNKSYNIKMLKCYQKLLKGEQVIAIDKNHTQNYLKLTGLVNNDRQAPNYLAITNRIYEKYFNQGWLDLTFRSLDRPFAKELKMWMDRNENDRYTALRGNFLTDCLRWANQQPDVTDIEWKFLNFSQEIEREENEKRELAEKAERFKKQSRRRRRNNIILWSLLFISFSLAIFARIETNRAKKAEAAAIEEKERAEVAEVAAIEEKERAEAAEVAAIEEKERAEAAEVAAIKEKERAEVAEEVAIKEKNKTIQANRKLKKTEGQLEKTDQDLKKKEELITILTDKLDKVEEASQKILIAPLCKNGKIDQSLTQQIYDDFDDTEGILDIEIIKEIMKEINVTVSNYCELSREAKEEIIRNTGYGSGFDQIIFLD